MGDDYEFRAAHAGDYGPLIEALRNGAGMTPERRALLIEILEGKLKRPPHRPAVTLKSQARRKSLVKRVRELEREGWKPTAAIIQTGAEFDCSERTVRAALRLAKDTMEMKRLVNQATATEAQAKAVLARAKVLAATPYYEAATKVHEQVDTARRSPPEVPGLSTTVA